jgi:hypothetical protein
VSTIGQTHSDYGAMCPIDRPMTLVPGLAATNTAIPMTSKIRFTLLANLGSLLLAVTDASQAYQLRQPAYMNVNLGGIYGKQHTCPRWEDPSSGKLWAERYRCGWQLQRPIPYPLVTVWVAV